MAGEVREPGYAVGTGDAHAVAEVVPEGDAVVCAGLHVGMEGIATGATGIRAGAGWGKRGSSWVYGAVPGAAGICDGWHLSAIELQGCGQVGPERVGLAWE